MSTLYIYCHAPRFVTPPDWSYDLSLFEIEGAQQFVGTKIPTTRERCEEDIKSAITSGRWAARLTWMPYNWTNPIFTYVKKSVSTLKMGQWAPYEWSEDEHYVDCIDSASVTYSGVNTPGEFRAKLRRSGYHPSVGWYITAFVSEKENTIEPSGKLMFYGRVTQCKDTFDGVEIVARDAIQNLADKDQLTINGLGFERTILYLCLLGGAYMYREAKLTKLEREYQEGVLKTYNFASGSCLDGINQLLDDWYALTLHRMYLRCDGGILVLCDYTRPNDLDIIDATMLPSQGWSLEQSMETTYTDAYIAYPKWISEQLDTITDTWMPTNPSIGQTSHHGAAWNTKFKLPYSNTYQGSVTSVPMEVIDGTRESMETRNAEALDRANRAANNVLRFHGYPTYRITLRQVTGISRLRPGMLIGVPYILDDDVSAKYMAVCVIRSVTHTFRNGVYTMDITAEIDPFDHTIKPEPFSFRDLTRWQTPPEKYHAEMLATAGWGSEFTIIAHEYTGAEYDELPVRMPLWLQESMIAAETAEYEEEAKPYYSL